tara:strand:+ start:252 stop:638 length:387 start_codon:yes stop_codon:yes gene_type:complete
MILILIGIINTIWFFNKNSISQEDFFNNAVKTSYHRSYDGIVKRKYYQKEGGRNTIVIEKNGFETHFDYVYEKSYLYEFIEIGDTLIKRNRNNSIVIKRAELDTTINLKFENLKGAELYSEKNEFLNN